MEAPLGIPIQSQQPVNANATSDDTFPGASQNSQTASEFINSQLQLEADAREALPYAFDHCTNPLGPLRQSLFSCLTCNPPPESPSEPYNAAGVCYSCSIACHGEHTLVELFNRRNFTCDCGTTRLPTSSPCTLRIDPETGLKGPIHSQIPATGNTYNQNFRNRFCGCGEIYNAHEEKGTMFQCLGLATEKDGGCGEDWWHPECVLGLGRGWFSSINPDAEPEEPPPHVDGEETEEPARPLPPGFPQEEDFEAFICYKCVNANPWIKGYAGCSGFLMPVFRKPSVSRTDVPEDDRLTAEQRSAMTRSAHNHRLANARTLDKPDQIVKKLVVTSVVKPSEELSSLPTLPSSNEDTNLENASTEQPLQPPSSSTTLSKKRKAEDTPSDDFSVDPDAKRLKTNFPPPPLHETLYPAPADPFSMFAHEDFRDRFCRCPTCYPRLRKYPQLLEEEVVYEPPLSETGEEGGGESVGTGSLLDRGEAALSNVDRVRAIEGVMVYNHLRDKVKSFLQPFAASGTPVAADDIKAYFEKLRGDDLAIKAAGGAAVAAGASRDVGGGDGAGDGGGFGEGRGGREQSGY